MLTKQADSVNLCRIDLDFDFQKCEREKELPDYVWIATILSQPEWNEVEL